MPSQRGARFADDGEGGTVSSVKRGVRERRGAGKHIRHTQADGTALSQEYHMQDSRFIKCRDTNEELGRERRSWFLSF